MNPIEQIMDENNKDNIILYDENNQPMEFMQIAVIPIDGVVYLILKPIEDERLEEDEALVFFIDEFEGEECISIVEDDEIVDRVFEAYYKLLQGMGLIPDTDGE